MAQLVQAYLINLGDNYRPNISNPPLQQYSPYQTDDVYCVDITYQLTDDNGSISTSTKIDKKQSTLAVQAYAITPIHCNFNQIARDYP
jgi:hypothetical protein